MFSFFLQTHVLSVRVSKGRANPGQDVPLSLWPGTKIFPCLGMSRDVPGQNHFPPKKTGKGRSKTGKGCSKTGKDVLNQERMF